MEIWDAYDQDGRRADRDLIRGEPIPQGLYHLVSEMLVRHVDGDYLLMQRDFQKEGYPGWMEATAGGSALKRETPLEAAKRELFEESGAVDFDIEPICDYRAWDENTLHGANGVVFHAVIQGNTAQSPPGGFARNLLADFPSYCPEIPCHTTVCLRNFYAICRKI